jgi:hypothetical protein
MQKRMISFGLAVAMVCSVIDLAHAGPEVERVRSQFAKVIRGQEQIVNQTETNFKKF